LLLPSHKLPSRPFANPSSSTPFASHPASGIVCCKRKRKQVVKVYPCPDLQISAVLVNQTSYSVVNQAKIIDFAFAKIILDLKLFSAILVVVIRDFSGLLRLARERSDRIDPGLKW
jgi:hypothetical protein